MLRKYKKNSKFNFPNNVAFLKTALCESLSWSFHEAVKNLFSTNRLFLSFKGSSQISLYISELSLKGKCVAKGLYVNIQQIRVFLSFL